MKNIYAGGKTNEAVQCRAIALALADALERCGFEAAANLTASMAERGAESNRWGADLHVCLHTNAFNAQVMGTRIFSYDLEGEGFEAAKAIFARLAPITPGTSENIKPYPALTVAPRAFAFAALISSGAREMPTKRGISAGSSV